MPERWVVNASPLIALSKIDHQHLLTRLADEIIVPAAVAAEIEAGPADDPARRFLAGGAILIVDIPPEPAILTWDLGAGETAVLSYALTHPDRRAVVDDGMARHCAQAFSIPIIGTLGVILRSRSAGLIPAASPVIKALQAQGFRLDENVIRVALLRALGEDFG